MNTTPDSDEPLDLGEIDPGQRQKWHPGVAWTPPLPTTVKGQPVVVMKITEDQATALAKSITWTERVENYGGHMFVEWPNSMDDARAMVDAILVGLGIQVTDGG
jgi:hypothetical protein